MGAATRCKRNGDAALDAATSIGVELQLGTVSNFICEPGDVCDKYVTLAPFTAPKAKTQTAKSNLGRKGRCVFDRAGVVVIEVGVEVKNVSDELTVRHLRKP